VTHIVKFWNPGEQDPLAANEYFCLQEAKKSRACCTKPSDFLVMALYWLVIVLIEFKMVVMVAWKVFVYSSVILVIVNTETATKQL
jgi:hypothetical protein